MDDTSKHVKIYKDSQIEIKRLEILLKDNNINSLIKNNFNSGMIAGFASNKHNVELYVYEEDFEKARELIQDFLERTGQL